MRSQKRTRDLIRVAPRPLTCKASASARVVIPACDGKRKGSRLIAISRSTHGAQPAKREHERTRPHKAVRNASKQPTDKEGSLCVSDQQMLPVAREYTNAPSAASPSKRWAGSCSRNARSANAISRRISMGKRRYPERQERRRPREHREHRRRQERRSL